MRKFVLALIGAAVLVGTVPILPQEAAANHRYGHICRTVVIKKVVWRHGRRYIVRERARRCRWV